jgi:hypothetical protein
VVYTIKPSRAIILVIMELLTFRRPPLPPSSGAVMSDAIATSNSRSLVSLSENGAIRNSRQSQAGGYDSSCRLRLTVRILTAVDPPSVLSDDLPRCSILVAGSRIDVERILLTC